jgi:hypothetical protein
VRGTETRTADSATDPTDRECARENSTLSSTIARRSEKRLKPKPKFPTPRQPSGPDAAVVVVVVVSVSVAFLLSACTCLSSALCCLPSALWVRPLAVLVVVSGVPMVSVGGSVEDNSPAFVELSRICRETDTRTCAASPETPMTDSSPVHSC